LAFREREARRGQIKGVSQGQEDCWGQPWVSSSAVPPSAVGVPKAPSGRSNNKRLRGRKGDKASNFPSDMVLDKPVNKNAN